MELVWLEEVIIVGSDDDYGVWWETGRYFFENVSKLLWMTKYGSTFVH